MPSSGTWTNSTWAAMGMSPGFTMLQLQPRNPAMSWAGLQHTFHPKPTLGIHDFAQTEHSFLLGTCHVYGTFHPPDQRFVKRHKTIKFFLQNLTSHYRTSRIERFISVEYENTGNVHDSNITCQDHSCNLRWKYGFSIPTPHVILALAQKPVLTQSSILFKLKKFLDSNLC